MTSENNRLPSDGRTESRLTPAKERRGINFLWLLLSLFVAVVLWLFVMTMLDPTSQTTISNLPVTVINDRTEDHELFIRGGLASTVDITVRGTMRDLTRLEGMRDSIVVQCSLAHIDETGQHPATIEVILPAALQDSVEVIRISPQELMLEVVAYAVRRVPVRVDISAVELDEDYRIDEDNIRIESIGHPDDVIANRLTVSGPADVVDYIEEVTIVLNATQASESFTQDVYIWEFLDAYGATIGESDLTFAEIVMVYVPVHFVKDVPLAVQIVAGGGIRQEDVESSVISPTSIRLQGEREILDGIHTIELEPAIILAELESMSQDFLFPVHVPVNGVFNVDRVEEATVSITISGVSERDVVVENFRVNNVPAGISYRIVPPISVRLRGPTASVQALNADDITVVVDLAMQGAPIVAGRMGAQATVNIRGAPLVAVIGELSVSLEIETDAS
ncbi:MAG: hypothetical protein FWE06_04625 [Oscillospiraceae bacterium]|nr:hypothetical protein [Oscillospiraceae bacterium]